MSVHTTWNSMTKGSLRNPVAVAAAMMIPTTRAVMDDAMESVLFTEMPSYRRRAS